MTKRILTTFAVLVLAGCSRQEPAESPAPPVAPAPEPAAGAPPPAPTVAAPAPLPPLPPEERVQWFQACWAAFNAKDWAKFAPCYAENAKSEQVDSGMPVLTGRSDIVEKGSKQGTSAFPDMTGEHQLTLLNGNSIVSVVLMRGTHTAALQGPNGMSVPPTNKKMGVLMVHAADTTDDGRAVMSDRFYADTATELGQLGVMPMPHRKVVEKGWPEKPVVIAQNSDVEKVNLGLSAKNLEAFNKHDSKAVAEGMANDVVWSDVAAPADKVGKAAVKRSVEELFKGFPDVKIDPVRSWAAGDYVVTEGVFSGTNSGNMPAMKLNKTGKPVSVRCLQIEKYEGGKLKNAWVFSNGLAFASQLGLVPPAKTEPKKADPAKPMAGTAPKAEPASGPVSGSTAMAPAKAPAAQTQPAGAKAEPTKTPAPATAPNPAAPKTTPAPTPPAGPTPAK